MIVTVVIQNKDLRKLIRWCLDNLSIWQTIVGRGDTTSLLSKSSDEWLFFLAKHVDQKNFVPSTCAVTASMYIESENEAALFKLTWG